MEEELYKQRLRYIRLLVQWQYRQEAPRWGKQAKAIIVQPQPTPASPSLDIIAGRYNCLQCPFCLANLGLPLSTRVKKKSKTNKLWDHVENLHWAELAAFGTGTKQCGLCGMRSINYLPSSVPEFKNHTKRVHGIRLRAWHPLLCTGCHSMCQLIIMVSFSCVWLMRLLISRTLL
jgi:hypothetical protein